MTKLQDRVAIVTGAASGQGAAISRRFVEDGARVLLSDRNEADGRALAASLGESAMFARLDVSVEDDWARAVALAESRFGGVDVLINNAGLFLPRALLDTDLENWDAHYRVNMLGTYLGMRAVIPGMVARREGLVVNTASNVALRGAPGLFAYCSTKWGIRGMTKTAAVELAPYNIRVNTLLPGIIDTPMYRSNGEEVCAEYDKLIPLGRRGTPQEIAGLVAFLASEAGAYMSGAELTIDGAMMA